MPLMPCDGGCWYENLVVLEAYEMFVHGKEEKLSVIRTRCQTCGKLELWDADYQNRERR